MCFRGGHPKPNEESQAAAVAMLDHVKRAGPKSLVIYLISGGGSSMVETPIDDTISLKDISETYDVLVHSGAPIAEINAVRKHLSAIKGGKLAVASTAGTQISLLISDVPDGMLDALASGPTMPDATTVSDCLSIYRKYDLSAKLPSSVGRLFHLAKLEEAPKSGHRAFRNSQWYPLVSNASVVQAAKEEAEKLGFVAVVDNSCDDWDYADAANYLFDRIKTLSRQAKRVCLISGGEVTVRLDRKVEGIGGRNQHLALYFATKIQCSPIAILSAGTDGIDGNSSATGAVTDGSTVARAKAAGFDVDNYLASYNSNPLLVALGDAMVTGPTGNNLRDLRIILSASPST
jgi:hydroxypyruvate reductase